MNLDAVWDNKWVGRGMGVLDGVVIIEGRGSFGMNLGRPIVTNKDLLHSCAEVREPIELSFGVMSVVGPGIHVLDGVHVTQKEGLFGGFFGILPHWFEWAKCRIFCIEIYSTRIYVKS